MDAESILTVTLNDNEVKESNLITVFYFECQTIQMLTVLVTQGHSVSLIQDNLCNYCTLTSLYL